MEADRYLILQSSLSLRGYNIILICTDDDCGSNRIGFKGMRVRFAQFSFANVLSYMFFVILFRVLKLDPKCS